MENKSTVMNIRDLLLVAVIGTVFGVVNAFYAAVDVAMIAALGPLGSSITIGVFFIAPLLASLIVQKPGAALLAGVILGFGETLAGNPWGIVTLIYGSIEGIGVELGYLLFFRYKRYDLTTVAVAAAVIVPIHFGYEYIQYGFSEYSVGYNLGTFGARVVSAVVGGWLAYQIGKAVARTGVLTGFAFGKAEAEAGREATS